MISLFAGIGGFDLGFERAGMKTVAQVEYDKYASKVLAHHYPDVMRFEDIRDVKGCDLPTANVVCGGSPCQDLSVAGTRRGLAGEKSQLFWEYHRIIDEVRPEWLVWENVPGALSSNGGRDFARVIFSLGELGYKLAWRVLDSQYFGVPQRRRRLFVVGCLTDGRAAKVLFERNSLPGSSQSRPETGKRIAGITGSGTEGNSRPTLQSAVYRMRGHGDYISDSVVSTVKSRDHKDATDLIVFDLQQITSKANRSRVEYGLPSPTLTQNSDVTVALDVRNMTVNEISATLQAKSNGGYSLNYINPVLHDYIVRRLTPVECERLQGFPDSWTAGQADTHRYKQLGNAVTVNVAEWIARQIMEVSA